LLRNNIQTCLNNFELLLKQSNSSTHDQSVLRNGLCWGKLTVRDPL